MKYIIIALLCVILTLFVISICTSIYFFRYTILRKKASTQNNNVNANTNWYPHLEFIRSRKSWLYKQGIEDVYIKSYDNLKLHGTLLRKPDSNNIVICFHGYTSNGINDYAALSKFYYEENFSVLMVDNRNHGESEGKYTGFGVLDRLDVKKWVEYIVRTFSNESNILLHGDSMGGATVLMASGLDLPANVRGIVSDCAFTSAYDVFSHVLKRDYNIPKFPVMFLTEILSKIFAGYGYKDVSTLNEVSKTNIPILFIHGSKDDFVPVWMTECNYNACNSPKELLIVDGADHAESYYFNRDAYESAIRNFIKNILI